MYWWYRNVYNEYGFEIPGYDYETAGEAERQARLAIKSGRKFVRREIVGRKGHVLRPPVGGTSR
jgi:hypothetical protein